VHYDSSIFAYDDSNGLTLNFIEGYEGLPQPDSIVENVSDLDADTDRIIELIWFDVIGGWAPNASSKIHLATLRFTALDEEGISSFNVTRSVDPLFGFQSTGTTVTVMPRNPWQNRLLPEDVDGDSFVAPIDVLLVINDLNQYGARRLAGNPNQPPPSHFLDVNGDRFVGPIDERQRIVVGRESSPQFCERDAAVGPCPSISFGIRSRPPKQPTTA